MGSHLTDKLMMDGHEVTVVDNFFTGRKRNVEHWIGHENFELINHDVVEPLYIEGEQRRSCVLCQNVAEASFILLDALSKVVEPHEQPTDIDITPIVKMFEPQAFKRSVSSASRIESTQIDTPVSPPRGLFTAAFPHSLHPL